MPVVTDLHKSIPAIAVGALAVLFWIAKGGKRTMAIIAVIIFAAAFADLLNAFTMKTQFRRDRPFQSLPEVKLRAPASGFSFPSNHATNCFTVATVLAFAFPQFALVFYLVALLVAFSRVYVGVHFPFDVTASALTGMLIGSAVWWLGKGTVEKCSKPSEMAGGPA
jgi:undecaprenyl-diphosphatase